MDQIDLSVLQDRAKARDFSLLGPFLRSITKDLTDFDPSLVRPRFTSEWGKYSRDGALRDRQERIIELSDPNEDDEEEWAEFYLHLVLLGIGHIAWNPEVARAWPKVMLGFTKLRKNRKWSRKKLQLRSPSMLAELERLEHGIDALYEMQAATFAVMATQNLMQVHGADLEEGGVYFLEEAIKWIMIEPGQVPMLGIWLLNEPFDSIARLLRTNPKEGVKALLDADRSFNGSWRHASDLLPKVIEDSLNLGIRPHITPLDFELQEERLCADREGLQFLMQQQEQEEGMFSLLNRVLVEGSF